VRLGNTFRSILGILATLFIGATITIFLVFPRFANQLADTFGNMGYADNIFGVEIGKGLLHVVIALLIDAVLFYFFILRPIQRGRNHIAGGLRIRKGQGHAYIDPESVRQQVIAAIAKVQDIQRADVNIANENGKAAIALNILTDTSLHGPRKKNEINREVRKIVEDQFGIEIAGQPTINFTLTPDMLPPAQPPMPVISSAPPMPSRPSSEPVSTRPMPPTRAAVMEPPPAPEDKPDEEEPAPVKPTGIELAKRDPFAPSRPPEPINDEAPTGTIAPPVDDEPGFRQIPRTEIIEVTDKPADTDMPSASDMSSMDSTNYGSAGKDEDDQPAAEG